MVALLVRRLPPGLNGCSVASLSVDVPGHVPAT
jgi:hypothetical protein